MVQDYAGSHLSDNNTWMRNALEAAEIRYSASSALSAGSEANQLHQKSRHSIQDCEYGYA
jgi:hypothetical protein